MTGTHSPDLVDQIITAAKLKGVALTEEFWEAVWLAEMPIRFDERRAFAQAHDGTKP